MLLTYCLSIATVTGLALALRDFDDIAIQNPPQSPLGLPVIHGHNEVFRPSIGKPLPGRTPILIDEEKNYYQKYENGSEGGMMRRSSCPAINVLANRGFINRNGRNITWEAIAQASRDIWNFGDDNIMLVLGVIFGPHSWPDTIDLDIMADDEVEHIARCPASPTRNDRDISGDININMTLYESLIGFTKDENTLSIEDMAEHHHLRHNQSVQDNPSFRFGNRDADCALAQYGNIIGVLGRPGPNGLQSVFLEDLKTFYVDEDIPKAYSRREHPFYFPEANSFIDRMTHHIGFQIERPWPRDDQDGRDVEPLLGKYEH